jgi:hypothetical protein
VAAGTFCLIEALLTLPTAAPLPPGRRKVRSCERRQRGGTADTLADCLIGLGKPDEAAKLLDNVDIPAVAQLAGDPNIGAGVQLLQAEIAYPKGDYATARKMWTPSLQSFQERCRSFSAAHG